MRSETESHPSPTEPAPKGAISSIIAIFLGLVKFAVIFGILAVIFIAVVGKPPLHEEAKPALSTIFTNSAAHKKILKKILKEKNFVLTGSRKDGLGHFAHHLADILVLKNKTVHSLNISDPTFEVKQLTRKLNAKISDLYIKERQPSYWIIIGLNDEILSESLLEHIQSQNSKNRIIFVSSQSSKIPNFKNIKFEPIDAENLDDSLSKALNVTLETAQVLRQFYSTPEALIELIVEPNYNAQAVLGDDYIPLDLSNFTKKELKSIQKLCKKGTTKANKDTAMWNRIGAVVLKNKVHWGKDATRLNYELNTGVNCKNDAVSQIAQNA